MLELLNERKWLEVWNWIIKRPMKLPDFCFPLIIVTRKHFVVRNNRRRNRYQLTLSFLWLNSINIWLKMGQLQKSLKSRKNHPYQYMTTSYINIKHKLEMEMGFGFWFSHEIRSTIEINLDKHVVIFTFVVAWDHIFFYLATPSTPTNEAIKQAPSMERLMPEVLECCRTFLSVNLIVVF